MELFVHHDVPYSNQSVGKDLTRTPGIASRKAIVCAVEYLEYLL